MEAPGLNYRHFLQGSRSIFSFGGGVEGDRMSAGGFNLRRDSFAARLLEGFGGILLQKILKGISSKMALCFQIDFRSCIKPTMFLIGSSHSKWLQIVIFFPFQIIN